MFLTDNPAPITLGEAGVYALLGYAVVFFGLILLMLVVIAIGKCFIAADKKRKAQAEPVVAASVKEVAAPTAPGAAGDLKLHNVEPKIAAMLMAIVADKLGKPLNELRFLSIREVEE